VTGTTHSGARFCLWRLLQEGVVLGRREIGLVEKPQRVAVRDFLSEAIMIAIVVVIGGAVSLIMGQHTWLDNF
jgi:hypothetical protein